MNCSSLFMSSFFIFMYLALVHLYRSLPAVRSGGRRMLTLAVRIQTFIAWTLVLNNQPCQLRLAREARRQAKLTGCSIVHKFVFV